MEKKLKIVGWLLMGIGNLILIGCIREILSNEYFGFSVSTFMVTIRVGVALVTIGVIPMVIYDVRKVLRSFTY